MQQRTYKLVTKGKIHFSFIPVKDFLYFHIHVLLVWQVFFPWQIFIATTKYFPEFYQ